MTYIKDIVAQRMATEVLARVKRVERGRTPLYLEIAGVVGEKGRGQAPDGQYILLTAPHTPT